MRTRFWTLIWILGILFPMAFLGRVWPAFGRLFDLVFAPNWMHVLMHGLLYAVLGFLLAGWIKPVSIRAGIKLIGLVMLVGILHESLQLLTAGIWPGWAPEVFDLAVDLGGAVCGLFVDRLLTHFRNPGFPGT